MNKAVIENDMWSADKAKVVIEEAQRKRRAEKTNLDPRFFVFNEATSWWSWDENKNKEATKLLYSLHFPFRLEPKKKSTVVDSAVAVTKLESAVQAIEIKQQ